jgi:hypothetical protein
LAKPRRPRKKWRSSPKSRGSKPDEIFEIAPNIVMARYGRMIAVHNLQSQEQHADYLEALRRMAATLPADQASHRDALQEIVIRTPMLQLLANWTVIHYTGNPETFREADIPPYLSLEYLTWLCLISDPRPALIGDWIPPDTYDEIENHLTELVDGVRLRLMTDHLRGGADKPTAVDEAVFRARLHHLIVRGPAYGQHRKEQLIELFEPVSADLVRMVGFDAKAAVALTEATGRLVDQALQDRQREAAETVARLRPVVEGRTPAEELDIDDQRLLAAIQARNASRLSEELHEVITAWFFFGADLAFIVTPGSLAGEAQLSVEVATSFLERLSLTLGQEPIADSLPSVYEPQHVAPLINLEDGTWFAHLAWHLWEAIRPTFEGALTGDKAAWDRYDRNRAGYLETKVLELIGGTSKHVTTHRALEYTFDDGAGPIRYELDGLATADDVAFLIEAKAGSLRPSSRRGAAESLIDDLTALIGEAHEQASRAARYIASDEEVSFQGPTGEVRVRREDYRRQILVTATLDELLAFATHTASLGELIALPAGSRAWAVNLSDLRVITELVEGVGQLVHYLERRLALEQMNITAQDELDWFGHYLEEGLYFRELKEGQMPGMSVGTYTEPLDDFFRWQAGLREAPAEKPRQKMPPIIRGLAGRLEDEGPKGFIAAICMLLEGSTEARQRLAQLIRNRRDRAVHTGFAAIRFGIEDGTMFIFAAGEKITPGQFRRYVEAAKYQGHRGDTIGVLEPSPTSGRLEVHAVYGPWKEDATTAERAREAMAGVLERPMPIGSSNWMAARHPGDGHPRFV